MARRKEEKKKVRKIGHSDLDGWGDTMQIWVERNVAYVGASGDGKHEGTTILDVANPKKPKVIARIPAPQNTHSHKVRVRDGIMVVNNEFLRGSDGSGFVPGVRVYDVSNPKKPRLITTFKTGGRGVHRFNWDMEREMLYLPTGDEGYRNRILWIVDFKDPAKPKLISKWWLPGQWEAGGEASQERPGESFRCHGAPMIHKDHMYIGYWDAGLVVLDVKDIAHPKLVAHFDWSPPYLGNTHSSVPLQGRDFLVVTDETTVDNCVKPPTFMWIMNIAAPDHPIPVSTYQVPTDGFCKRGGRFGAHNVHEDIEDLVYVTWFNAGLRIVDISNPYSPKEVGYYIPETKGKHAAQSNEVFIDKRGLIYLGDRAAGGMDVLEYTG